MKDQTRTKSIKLFCLSCFGWKEGGGKGYTGHDQAVKMVRECESEKCPLFYYRNGKDERPDRKKKVVSERQKENFARIRKDSTKKT